MNPIVKSKEFIVHVLSWESRYQETWIQHHQAYADNEASIRSLKSQMAFYAHRDLRFDVRNIKLEQMRVHFFREANRDDPSCNVHMPEDNRWFNNHYERWVKSEE